MTNDRTNTRREYTVTVIVEHVGGPPRERDWENVVPALLENILEDDVRLHTENDATYRIVQAVVDDCMEVTARG